MIKKGHHHDDAGLQVTLRKIPGVTKRGMLKSPYNFQVAPLDEFAVQYGFNWTDYDTISRGTFSRPGGRALRTFQITTLVVDSNPRWAVYTGPDHHDDTIEPGGPAPSLLTVSRDLQGIIHAGTPFRVVVLNRALYRRPDLDMAVTLRDLVVRERAGEIDTRYLDFSFTEYRTAQMARRGYGKSARHDLPAVVKILFSGVAVVLGGSSDGGGGGGSDHQGGGGSGGGHDHEEKSAQGRVTIGTMQHPATMRLLAKFFYGDPGNWTLIAKANGIDYLSGSDDLGALNKNRRREARVTIPDDHRRGHGGDGRGHVNADNQTGGVQA